MAAITQDAELERFKCEIDLRAYAVDQGYAYDRAESEWRVGAKMLIVGKIIKFEGW